MSKKLSPFFWFITGPMFAGKTEKIIKTIKYFQTKTAYKILTFKPKLDQRFKNDAHFIVSHNKKRFFSFAVEKLEEIEQIIAKKAVDLIFVSEINLFPPSLFELFQKILKQKIAIICEGLTLDFKKRPFPVIKKILTLKPKIIKLSANCFYCFGKADFSQRIVKDEATILVGSSDSYRPVCASCHGK